MIAFRVWKDSNKDNWQDVTTEAEAMQLDFGFGYDKVELNQWSKEAHLAEINALHEEEFKRRLLAAEYVGEWELSAVLADSENEYFDEAVLIINYWWNGWDAIKAYSETVTEENFIDPQTFVDNL
jgi:hypothetical protein